jgi:hypothetical protein
MMPVPMSSRPIERSSSLRLSSRRPIMRDASCACFRFTIVDDGCRKQGESAFYIELYGFV